MELPVFLSLRGFCGYEVLEINVFDGLSLRSVACCFVEAKNSRAVTEMVGYEVIGGWVLLKRYASSLGWLYSSQALGWALRSLWSNGSLRNLVIIQTIHCDEPEKLSHKNLTLILNAFAEPLLARVLCIRKRVKLCSSARPWSVMVYVFGSGRLGGCKESHVLSVAPDLVFWC
jgi:hypothetical protein